MIGVAGTRLLARGGRGASDADAPTGDRGSASIWVLAVSMLLIAVAGAGVLRAGAVLARHRAEAAADLAALAAAGQIGVASDPCRAAARIAAANGAGLRACVATLADDGRSGSVTVTVGQSVRLPLLGVRDVIARARAIRDPAAPSAVGLSRR